MGDTKITWRRRVESWRASGLTADEFAAQHGMVAGTLRWWASQLKREQSPPQAPLVRMAQVIRSASPSARRGSVVIEVVDTRARARVTVESGVERETLDVVFGALGIGGGR